MGIGVDIIEVARFNGSIDDKNFLSKIFTDLEVEYCRGYMASEQHLAARFAAKEAMRKALPSFVPYNKIEVFNDDLGAPHIRILDSRFASIKAQITLSHTGDMAVAFVVVEDE